MGLADRLTSQLLVQALVRTAQSAGGMAMVLHKGEQMSGAIVVQILERGQNLGLFERVTDLDGRVSLMSAGPASGCEPTEINQYIERRTTVDPDIWFVELDIADGQRLAAEVLGAG